MTNHFVTSTIYRGVVFAVDRAGWVYRFSFEADYPIIQRLTNDQTIDIPSEIQVKLGLIELEYRR